MFICVIQRSCIESDNSGPVPSRIQGLFIADEPVLSLYAHGKLTGCVIDFGHGKTGA